MELYALQYARLQQALSSLVSPLRVSSAGLHAAPGRADLTMDHAMDLGQTWNLYLCWTAVDIQLYVDRMKSDE